MNDAKNFILYLKEYADAAEKVKEMSIEEIVEYGHKTGFDFSAEEWEETYAKRESFISEDRELPKSCGCGW